MLNRSKAARAGAISAAVCLLVVWSASAAAAPPGAAALPARSAFHPLAVDLANVTELVPNQSVASSSFPPSTPMFKVFANRSVAAPEVLLVTLEASGGGFATGSLSVFDPHQVLIDERTTLNDGDINASSFIVPETGYYLFVIQSAQLYYWSITVNLTIGTAAPSDNDNDIANATAISGPSGSTVHSLTDWTDLVDIYAVNLTLSGGAADTLLVNLTSPGTADLDVYLFHLEAGFAVFDSFSISPFGTEFVSTFARDNLTHYIWVMSYAGSSSYTMSWVVFETRDDDNNQADLATPLATGNYTNGLARWDQRDYFRFDVPANTTINVSAHTIGFNSTSRTPDLQIVLWNATFDRVTWSFLFDPDERINALVPAAGAYFMEVFLADNVYYLSQSLTMNYTLSVRVDPPPALVDPNWTAEWSEDTPGVLDLRAVVAPDPGGESLAYRVVAVQGSAGAAIGPDGYTLTVTPAADWFGNATVSIEATDAWYAIVLNLPVSWTPVNDAPRLRSGADVFEMDEDASSGFAFAAAVFDPEGDPVTISSVDPDPPLTALTLPAGVQLSAPPNYNGVLALRLGGNDAIGATFLLSIAIHVLPVNDAPVFQAPVGPFVIAEDADIANATFAIAGLATDPDGDAVTFAVSEIPNVVAVVANGTLRLDGAPDFAGDVDGTLFARDAFNSTSIRFVVRITPVNDSPAIAFALTQRVAHENESFSLRADATDIDTPLDALRYSFYLDGAPVSVNSTSPTVTVVFTFDEGGYHVLRVEISDGERSVAGDVPVFVAETNRAPSAQVLAPRGAHFRAGDIIAFSARAIDPDGQDVNISWVVDGTLVSSSPTFSLAALGAGTHTVLLLVSDGESTSLDESSFTVDGSAPGLGPAAALLPLAVFAVLARKRRQ